MVVKTLFCLFIYINLVDSTEKIWDAKYKKYLEKGMDEEDAIQQSNEKITPLVQRQFLKRYGDACILSSTTPQSSQEGINSRVCSLDLSSKNERYPLVLLFWSY
jgi:hypothetical protein